MRSLDSLAVCHVSNVNETPPDKYAESRFPAGYNNTLDLRSSSVRNVDEKPPDKYVESRFNGVYNNVLGLLSASVRNVIDMSWAYLLPV
ncbi:hypothetical protein AVEN_193464-1 [Araneus ventricosus]|uniref:Uncharacterized protein n=1 Tax=Araneus ventricosus TaxID=182803 RepID=A0A4Y2WJA6_ARAVE|nr:hypothetical protein AVEN_193464-1 [Araneus ventricosus]